MQLTIIINVRNTVNINTKIYEHNKMSQIQ